MPVKSFLQARNRVLIAAAVVLFVVLLALKLAVPINLAAVDIGRHIVNGQLVLAGNTDILYKNFYSFSYPDYPFVNHHWFFGVIAALIFKFGGFTALSYFFIAVMAAAVLLFLGAAFLRGHKELSLLLAFLVLPVLWDRHEIRPEGISLLMMGLYFYVLTRLSLGKIRHGTAFIILTIAQIIWVNTHIFFFMGPLLVAVFLWEGKNRGCSVCVKRSVPLLLLTTCVNIINPSGLAGMLTPFNIFKGFGYRLAENQNVFFMMSFFPKQGMYPYFLCIAALGVLGIVIAFWSRGFKKNIAFVVLLCFTAAAGIKAVRLMPAYAVFLIPLGSFLLSQYQDRLSHQAQSAVRTLMLVLVFSIGGYHAMQIKPDEVHIGLYPGVNASAEFFKARQIKGPIFSNYDIGGYLIYHLHDQEKVFVDNRQEAFPKEFFKDVYIKIQQDEAAWQKAQEQFQFNVIYFYRHDLTDWGQGFLIARINDPQWAPVYVDDVAIMFLKRNDKNMALIRQLELPKSMFAVRKG